MSLNATPSAEQGTYWLFWTKKRGKIQRGECGDRSGTGGSFRRSRHDNGPGE